MSSENNYQKHFIIGTTVLVLLVIGAIALAVSFKSNGESGLIFNDNNDPAFGPANAKVVIREFSDFECPACRLAEEGVAYVKETYGDKVRLVWNDFPLAIHQSSFLAALAARCAEEQGKFWEYHNQLFARQDEWAKSDVPLSLFDQYAKDLSLDTNAFAVCLSTKRQQNKINDDALEGNNNKVRATPTFFINNKRFEGALPNKIWKEEIDAALKP